MLDVVMAAAQQGDEHTARGIGGLGIVFLIWGGWHLVKLLLSSKPKDDGKKKK
jgi:hypothetical protein